MKLYIVFCELMSRLHTYYYSKFHRYSIGAGSVVFYKALIIGDSKSVSIGSNCLIGRTSINYHGGMPYHTRILCDGVNSCVVIGNNCRINGAYIHAKQFITIGNNCVIASGVSIMDSNGHIVNSLDRTKGHDNPKGITIGNNVWIGMNAIILKGSSIGDNSIIGAGCVVSGTVPPNSIVRPAADVISHLSI